MSDKQDSFITDFFSSEAAGGIVLMLAALLAIFLANSPMHSYYALLLDTPVEIRVGLFEIAKPLLLWINDGLMAVFFFLVGLELKRELVEGELSNKRNIVLPGMGAVGGMAVPALFYSYFNFTDAAAMGGWAIPVATDIAFALGVLSLLGSRVPLSLKLFLTSLAIFDDIGAILIIASFYTANISIIALIVTVLCIFLLAVLNMRGIESKGTYVMVGMVMWVALLKSGVHATLAGVILAMFIPIRSVNGGNCSPLKEMEKKLHVWVAFFILPVFAFANAGVTLKGVGAEHFFHGVPLGIAVGLFVGKQVGVFGFCWLTIRLGLAVLPKNMSWSALYGTSALCGIGFTMSLFIGSLAFEETGVNLMFDERLGIIMGSFFSGIVGYMILRANLPSVGVAKKPHAENRNTLL